MIKLVCIVLSHYTVGLSLNARLLFDLHCLLRHFGKFLSFFNTIFWQNKKPYNLTDCMVPIQKQKSFMFAPFYISAQTKDEFLLL